MSGDLPFGWTRSALSGLGTWGSGGTPSRNDPDAFGPGIPWLKIGDLTDGPVRDAAESITKHGLANSAAKLLDAGTLLVAMYGSIGKLGITTFPCATNQAIASCVPGPGVDLRYLFYALLNERQRLLSLGQGGTQLNISQTLLKAHEINVAPLNEQQRIVSRIEELFSEIDEGERALERVGQLVERYRQSVLKAAVTGELTREWRESRREFESASDLLVRVSAEMRKSRSPLGRWAAESSPFDVPESPALPPNWTWATVEQLCFVETGSTPKRGEAKYYDGGTIPWITSGAVNAARITEPTEHITAAAIAETNAKVFPAGTLIVAMYGEGKTRGKVSELGIGAATNQACAALLVEHLDPAAKAYLRLFFEKHYEELRAMAAGGVQPNLNLSIIKQTVLPLPPLAEMREICDRVDRRLSESRSVGQEVADRAPVVRALRQSILKAAFSGQLVPQDPRDEPASALLARLAAQAAEAPRAARRRGAP